MMRALVIIVIIGLSSAEAISQIRIDKVERINSYPATSIQITGEGFSSSSSDLRVSFGTVNGTITVATPTSITVTVPAQARLSSVEVINVSTKRSAKSPVKFIPNFSGELPFVNSFLSKSFPVGSLNSDIFDLCACDLDADGLTDFVGSNFNQSGSNLMLLVNTSTTSANNTTLNFTTSSIPLAAATIGITCGDLNGDGKAEIVATRGDRNGFNPGNTIYVFPNTSTPGNVTFGTPLQLNTTLGDLLRDVAVHDLNRDGQPEIIVSNASTNTLYIYENNLSSGTILANEFTRIDKVVTGNTAADATAAGTLALEIGDMDGDGWPDIVTAPNKNYMNQKVFLFKNSANGSLDFVLSSVTITTNNTAQSINDIALADFNKDGLMDFVVADKGVGIDRAFVFRNAGNLTFLSVNGTTGFVSPTAWSVDVADMKGDGFIDFITGNRTSGTPQTNIYLGDGATIPAFTKNLIAAPRVNWFIKTGDFDGDSKPDIAMTSNDNAAFGIHFLQNRNCHQPVILNENPISVCGAQTKILNAVALQGVAYSWSTGDTGPSTVIDVGDAGTVTLTAVGDGGTCSQQATITVIDGGGPALSQPVITDPVAVCAGSGLTLLTNNVAGATYLWSGPNNYAASTAAPSSTVTAAASLDQAGDYYLQVKVGNCTSIPSLPKKIPVVSPESFTITGIAAVCEGQPATLTVSASGYNFQWKKDGAPVGTNSDTYSIPSTAEADQGSYTVDLSHQTISCSSTTDAFVLTVYELPVASFIKTPSQVCVGTEITFDASGALVDNTAPTVTYTWNFGDATNGTGITALHTYITAQAAVSASLTISYTGVTGCSDTENPGAFAVSDAIQPVITTDPPAMAEICSDGSESVTLEVAGSYTSYIWTPVAPDEATLVVNSPGTYAVVTTDANGCIGNAEIILAPKPGCDVTGPKVPKVFTPDGKGPVETETWIIQGVPNLDNCTISVFDGRGRRIYEVKGFPTTGWDGTVNGKPVPHGTYYYVLNCPDSKPLTGSVLIVR